MLPKIPTCRVAGWKKNLFRQLSWRWYVIDLQNGSLPVQITKFSNFCLEWNSRETRLLLEISHTQAKNIVCTVIQGDGFCKSCVSSVCIILPVILHFLTAKFAFHSFSLIPNLFLLFKRENILLIDRLSLTAHWQYISIYTPPLSYLRN